MRDNASSFANGENTRFTSSNICDFILFDDVSKTLFLLECKSTKGSSVSLSMIRDNQIKGLKEAGKHNLVPGLLINFRNEANNTFFISVNNFSNMINAIGKKSFNLNDLENFGAIKIESTKKRTRHTYNIQKLIQDLNVEVNNGDKIKS